MLERAFLEEILIRTDSVVLMDEKASLLSGTVASSLEQRLPLTRQGDKDRVLQFAVFHSCLRIL